MSVIARCATFVATKTSLKQQFAVNNRSSATKIVRYALKRERDECLHLIILRDWFFFVFWEFELHRKWRENDFVLLLLSFFSRKTTFDDDDDVFYHRRHRYADTTNTNETLSSSVRTRES